MSEVATSIVIDSLLDGVIRCLDTESAQRLAELAVDDQLQERVDILAERANEGILTPEERSEYETFVDVSDLIAILRIKARRALDSKQHRD